jgi:hypothetical protein
MTTAHIDAEAIETTRSEKLLAFVLAAFLLVGGLWAYFEPLDRVHASGQSYYQPTQVSPTDRAAVERLDTAEARLRAARRREDAARVRLTDRREAFRTALEAHQPAAGLQAAYQRASAELATRQDDTRAARLAVTAARGPARSANRRITAAGEQAAAAAHRRQDRLSRDTFLLRLGWVMLCLGWACGCCVCCDGAARATCPSRSPSSALPRFRHS